MNVAVIGTRGFPDVQGGVETHCENLYPCLARSGCTVTVYARKPYVPYTRLTYQGVSLVAIDCPRNKYLETITYAGRALFQAWRLNPDLLHLQGIGPSVFAPLARLLGMKVVVTHHGQNYQHKKWGFFARQFLQMCEALGMRWSDEIIAVSDDIARFIREEYGRDATTITNGVTVRQPEGTTEIHTRLGLQPGRYILSVGRIVPEKGFHDLVRAFRKVEHPDWQLVIVGSADHVGRYSRYFTAMAGQDARVVLAGFQKGRALGELYSNAGLFVLPSYYEGLPIALLEAMSYGLSCIASDIPANRSIPLEQERYFSPGDTAAMVRLMERFMLQPFEKEARKKQVELIRQDFDWGRAAQQTLSVYSKLVPQTAHNPSVRVAAIGFRGFPDVQGGIEKHCEMIYPRLARRGIAITAFTRKPYVETDMRVYEGVALQPLPCPRKRYLETLFHTLVGVLKAASIRPDILHIHAIGPSVFTPLARLLGMHVVVTTHGADYERSKWKKPAKLFLKLCESVGMRYADAVIAIADTIAADVERKYGRIAAVIPNGVEIPVPAQSTGALQRFSLEQGRYVLAVGRIVPEKGFHDLIAAFQTAAPHGWKLAIAGRVDYESVYSQRLKEQAAQNPNVVLTGFQKGVPLRELYSHAALFVIPSYFEGLPIALLEALSYGLPCIASDIPGNRNIHLPPEHFFAAGDIAGLAAAITRFAVRPVDQIEMRAQVEMLEREFNWDTIAGQVLQVYRNVLTARGKPHRGLPCSKNRKR